MILRDKVAVVTGAGRGLGRQLLAPAWVADATRSQGPVATEPHAGPDWQRGYGWSFWQARHGYRGDGAFGQYAVVLPEQDVAVAITSEVEDMQQLLDLRMEQAVAADGVYVGRRGVDRGGGPGDPMRRGVAREQVEVVLQQQLPCVGVEGALWQSFSTGRLRRPAVHADHRREW